MRILKLGSLFFQVNSLVFLLSLVVSIYIIFQILFQFQFIYFSVGSPAILIIGGGGGEGRGGLLNIFKYIL